MGKKKASIGCLFWLALILLVIVIVLANLKTANKIIKQTGFQDIIADFFEKKEKPIETEPENESPEESDDQQPDRITENREKEEDIQVREDDEPQATEVPAPHLKNQNNNLRKALIYFVMVDETGKIHLKGFERAVYYNDSPLKETLLMLLEGPYSNEINMEYYSMIPEKTHLKNIHVKGSIAFIDFNENFRFNPLGAEGLKAQLDQVVYTATEFANITSVQILIEGDIVNYLGPEGIYIGEPLSRESLNAYE